MNERDERRERAAQLGLLSLAGQEGTAQARHAEAAAPPRPTTAPRRRRQLLSAAAAAVACPQPARGPAGPHQRGAHLRHLLRAGGATCDASMRPLCLPVRPATSAPSICAPLQSTPPPPAPLPLLCRGCLNTAFAVGAGERRCPTCRAPLPVGVPALAVNTSLKALAELLLPGGCLRGGTASPAWSS